MRLRNFRRLMSDVFWSPVRCLTASDKDPSTALGMTFVESRSLPFVFIPPWEDPSCAFGAALLQGPTHGADSLAFPFIPPRGFILRLWRAPSPRAYSWSRVTRFSFHSASRIHPAPLARPFFKGLLMERIHSLFLSFRLENPSCAFGAVLFQGPTHGAESLAFPFIPLRGIHPAPSAQSFSKGLLMEQSHSLFLLYRFEESILRLWRSPFPRAYSWSGFTRFSFHSASRIHPAPLARPFSKGLLIEQIHSLFLSFRLEDPSCAFGAVLFQGPTHGAESLAFPFIPLRGIILRLWRAPSSRGYSISKTLFFHLTPVTSH